MKGFELPEFLLRGDVSVIKKELIAARLALTESESTGVWEVWELYSAETNKINGIKSAILKEYSGAYDTLTDEQADNLVRRWLGIDIEQAQLRQRFAEMFRRVLSGKKAAALLQLERRISMMMELQITSGLPLAQGQIDFND